MWNAGERKEVLEEVKRKHGFEDKEFI